MTSSDRTDPPHIVVAATIRDAADRLKQVPDFRNVGLGVRTSIASVALSVAIESLLSVERDSEVGR